MWWKSPLIALLALMLVIPTGGLLAPASAAEQTKSTPDGATVTYDDEAVIGEKIHISGTGWLAKPDMVDAGEEGSVIGFKLIDPNLGQLSRTFALDNPRLGDPVTNDTVWGTVWAESDGSFELELDWPTAQNAVTDPGWEAGDTFQVQLLSGTMYSNEPGVDPSQRPDVSRTIALDITVAEGDGGGDPGDPEPSAPTITQQPESVEAANGAEVSFTAAADGEPAPTVQWQRTQALSASEPAASARWIDIADATDPTLTVTAGTNPNQNNRWYRAVFTNEAGEIASNPAKLSIAPAPTVTTHPAGQTISEGETASFSAEASDAQAEVQWESTKTALPNGEPDEATFAPVAGATESTLEISGTDADAQHGTFYRAVFTNASGSVKSHPAQLRFFEKLDTNGSVTVDGESYGPPGTETNDFSVSAPNAIVKGQPIVIEGTGYVHPDGEQGSVSSFLVDASYSGDPNTLSTTREVTNPVDGKVSSDKRLHAIVQANPDGTWRAEIPWPDENNTTRDAAFFESNWSAGSQHMVRILSGSLLPGDYQRGISVRFTVVDEPTEEPGAAPAVTAQPENATVEAGQDASFTAAASGDPAPSVQWESKVGDGDWTPVAGATDPTLTLSAVSAAQSGTQYRAVFTNSAGSATSDPATLTVTEAQDPDLNYTVLPNGGGTLITPKQVEVGGTITISGTGFFKTDDTGGSGGPIFINQPSGGTGPVNVKDRTIENQIPGSTFNDPRAHGVFHSDDDGNWSITVPFPTPENSTLTAETAWQAGQTQSIRILTGSLVEGDRTRSAAADFELVEGDGPVEEAPSVTTQPENVSVEAGEDASFTAEASGTPEPTVQWQSKTGDGDWTAIADATDPTLTLSAVTAEQDGTQYRAVFTNSAGEATSDAATLTVTEEPDPSTGEIVATTTTVEQYDNVWFNLSDFEPGSEVTVELADGEDGAAIASKDFTIGDDGNTANPDGQTYRKVLVPRDAAPGANYVLRVVDADGAALATSQNITVTEATTRVFNPGDHAGGEEDLLVQRGGTWTFHAVGFEPDGKLTATAEVDGETVTLDGIDQISAEEKAWQLDGNGDTTRDNYTRVQIPSSVAPGPLDVTFTDGTETVTRTLEIEPPEEAAVTVAETGELGGTLRVTGEGFVHPTDGGSTIAIKIDDGAYSRLGDGVHQNKTIWWIVEADEHGSFSIDMPLPNGTTEDGDGTLGSTPAFEPGENHTLRFLTGSLKPGDQSRTLQSTAFAVTDSGEEPGAAPQVTTQPEDVSVEVGEDASFTAAASGDPAPAVQWESKTGDDDWTAIADATDPTLTLNAVTAEQNGTQYRAVFTNSEGDATTDAATLTVTDSGEEPGAAPQVTTQPEDVSVEVGEDASFTAAASGDPAPAVQWESKTGDDDWTAIADATDPTLTLNAVTAEQNGTQYRAVFTNSEGDATTDAATLTVTDSGEPGESVAPAITSQPADTSAKVGGDATFTATASGTPTPDARWESSTDGQTWEPVENGAPLADADEAPPQETTLTVRSVTAELDGRQFRVVFTNSEGEATSEAATLTVTDDGDPGDPGEPGDPDDPSDPGTPGGPDDPSEPGNPGGKLPATGSPVDGVLIGLAGLLLLAGAALTGWHLRRRTGSTS